MSAHTPGPWRYRVGDQWSHSIVTDHGLLPDESPSTWAVASINVRRDEHKANARLMAAAPKLLAALRIMHERLTRCAEASASASEAYDSFYQALVQVAITEATGEKP